MLDHVVVDVEIAHTIEETPGGWSATDKLGVAVACVWEYRTSRMRVYGPLELTTLQDRLRTADRISGYNIWKFDFPVIWDIFHEVSMLGNSRLDPCSRMLKREPAERWLSRQCNPRWTVVYVGIAWNERHRFEGRGNSKGIRARRAEDGWEYDAPLLWPPRMEREELVDWLKAEGIALPRLYHMGFSHNNCGGFCVRAGHDHYRRLLTKLPERFHYHEQREEEFQEFVGDSNTILRDRTGGQSRRLPLSVLRQRVEAGWQEQCGDSQGCGCFLGDPEN